MQNKNDWMKKDEDHTGRTVAFVAVGIVCLVLALWLALGSWATVSPGNRGVRVTLGAVTQEPLCEGFHLKKPFISRIDEVSIREQRDDIKAQCYSSDLQQVDIQVAVIYSVPERNVITVYRDYANKPMAFVDPVVQEAVKEVVSLQTAEDSVKKREAMKPAILSVVRERLKAIVQVADIVIVNVDLSDKLEHAIEAKMVQQQQAEQSKFAQDQARVEAETAAIRAKGEADAIRIRGEALRENRDLIQLQIVEKWDGHTPTTIVTGEGGGATSILLPVK